MDLAPLLGAAPQIRLHAIGATLAFGLGLVQFARPKGTPGHRLLGWTWVVIMALVAASSFLIHQIRLLGPWSPIHLLSILTIVMLPIGVWYAHSHNVRGHRMTMIGIFIGGLVIAGGLTFVPGRIMHSVVFGG